MTSVALYNWRPSGGPSLIGGTNSVNALAQTLGELGKPSQANGILLTLRAKGPTRLELSYWDMRNTSDLIAPRDLSVFGANISAGDYLAVDYRIRSAKLSWNYLSYPVPTLDAKLRIKTLFEVQYTTMTPGIVFPFKVDLPVKTTSRILLPTFGLGAEYVLSPKHFRMEARFSGFGLPGHSVIWDGEGSLVGRFGSVEIFGGMKGYHFRTSTKTDIYMDATLWGPNAGLRWVFR
jgi:hypothetical protein